MPEDFLAVFHSQKRLPMACNLQLKRLRTVAQMLEVMFVSAGIGQSIGHRPALSTENAMTPPGWSRAAAGPMT